MSANPPDACLNRNRARIAQARLPRHKARFGLPRLRINCRPVKIAVALCVYLACLWLSPAPVYALDPNKRVTQYIHTSWRIQDGSAPDGMFSITQTSDGFLWFTSATEGMYRFDGVRLLPWTLAVDDKTIDHAVSFHADHLGGLWARGRHEISYQRGGVVTSHFALEGQYRTENVSVDSDGSLWVLHLGYDVREPLCRVTGQGVKCFGESDGLRLVPYGGESLLADGKGGYWLGGQRAVVHWHDGRSDVYPIEALKSHIGDAVAALAYDAEGSLWVGILLDGPGRGLGRLEGGVFKSFVIPGFDGSKLAVFAMTLDRNGSLWVGTRGDGLFRIRGASVEHYGRAEGLSGDSVQAIYEDREGILWVTTTNGIDSFRDAAITTFSKLEGLGNDEALGVLASRDGAIWVANKGSLDHIDKDGAVSSIRWGKGLPGDQVTAMLEDRGGKLWMGVYDGLYLFENGRFRRIPEPDHQPFGLVLAMTEDADGNIWAFCTGKSPKLIRIRDSQVREEFPTSQIPLGRIAPDPQGGIWIGPRSGGGLVLFRDGVQKNFPTGTPANMRTNHLLVQTDGSVLAAFDDGLVGLRQGQVQRMTTKNGLPCNSVYSVIEDKEKRWWLLSECGIVELPDSELQRWWADPEAVVQTRLYDALDGAQPRRFGINSAALSPDGRVWFATGSLVQMIDPSRLSKKALPAQTYIESVVVDRKEFIASGNVQLAPHPRELQINYTSPTFQIPQRVKFRYRLDGFDHDWHDAGTRRQAFYTDLPPGNYSFSVIACNSDGVWSDTPSIFNFSVAPAFYQTRWFRFSLLILFLAVLWTAYQLRVRQLATRFNRTFEARVSERTRIARELHDTLLQSFQGLLLRFQSAAKLLPERPDEARQRLDGAIQQAAEAITEGRDAVQGLRSSGFETNDLANSIAAVAEELTKDTAAGESPVIDLEVEGEPRGLNPVVRDDVYRIACEALRNAFRHAQARRITVEIRYDKRHFRLRVSDDGKGIDEDTMQRQPSGHFGLPGMRERAESVGGRLEVWSKLNSGTQVELSIPGNIAYDRTSPPSVTAVERPA